MENTNEKQYWLWVTTPEYYLNEDGNERDTLEPSNTIDTGGWWTCSKYTQKGDLILLYRARGKSDIKYLIQAESDAYLIGDDPYARSKNWSWGCDYRPIYKFDNPVTLSDLRTHARLQEWNALKAQFQGKYFSINIDNWTSLNELLIEKNPEYSKIIKKVEKSVVSKNILLEEQLENEIVNNLSLLNKFGYELELFYDEKENRSGRQFVCRGAGGRIDLLCVNKKTNGYTIIELKNVKASRVTFAQICEYIGYVRDYFNGKKMVDGVVISRGCDNSFFNAQKTMPKVIKLIDLTELGFD